MIAAALLALALQSDVERHIADLRSDDLAARGKAEAALVAAGRQALPALEALSGDKDVELRVRAAAIVEEISWGAAKRAVQLQVRLANRDAFRTFGAREITDAETRAWLPELRFWTLEVTAQNPDLSSLVLPRVFFAPRFEPALLEGAGGLDKAVRDAKVPIKSAEDAERFVKFMKRLQIPRRFTHPDEPGVLERTESGWTWTEAHGRVHRLYVGEGLLRGVGYDEVRK